MSTQDTTATPALHDLGDLIIRASAGLILVPHGAQKLFGAFGGHGLDGTAQFFSTQLGLEPAFLLALLVAVTEFFGGLALAVGLLTRIAALGIVVLMALGGSTAQARLAGYEYPLLWGLVALGYVLRGGNRHSLDRKLGLPV